MEITIKKLKEWGFKADGSFQYSKRLAGEWSIIAPIHHKAGRLISFPILSLDGEYWCYIDSLGEVEELANGIVDAQIYYDENS